MLFEKRYQGSLNTDKDLPCIEHKHQQGQKDFPQNPEGKFLDHNEGLSQKNNCIDTDFKCIPVHLDKASCIQRPKQEYHKISNEGGENRSGDSLNRDEQEIKHNVDNGTYCCSQQD